MPHFHPVYDTDPHFSVDEVTRAVSYVSADKLILVQDDHNSQRYTFELPRYMDGHDLMLCDVAQVHYLNIDASGGKPASSKGVYLIEDLQIHPDDNDYVVCSWLISGNATKYVGSLNFMLRFACSSGGMISYSWSTAVYSGITVASSINNGEAVVEQYADILQSWYMELLMASEAGNVPQSAFYATGSDYAISMEWSDGNPSNEDRLNRFVQLTDGGTKISLATSSSDICGATTNSAAFVENYNADSVTSSLVGILGIVDIIDNGTCTVGECCMSDDNGYAVPSSNNMGYRVMARVDETKIKVAVKPNDDMIQRIRTDISSLQTTVSDINTDITELQTTVSDINTDITELQTIVGVSNTNIADLTDLTGTKWTFKEDLSGASEINASLDFINQSSTYYAFGYYDYYGDGSIGLYYSCIYDYDDYGNPCTDTFRVYEASSGGWSGRQSYRTIEITGGADATNSTVIAWLQANATQIVEPQPTIADNLATLQTEISSLQTTVSDINTDITELQTIVGDVTNYATIEYVDTQIGNVNEALAAILGV